MTAEALTALFAVMTKVWGLPPGLLLALCTYESGGLNPHLNYMDHGRRSYGLCSVQHRAAVDVMPGIKEEDLLVPQINVNVAASYLHKQHKRYGSWTKAILAYNAGSYKVKHGIPVNWEYFRRVNRVWVKQNQEKLN